MSVETDGIVAQEVKDIPQKLHWAVMTSDDRVYPDHWGGTERVVVTEYRYFFDEEKWKAYVLAFSYTGKVFRAFKVDGFATIKKTVSVDVAKD